MGYIGVILGYLGVMLVDHCGRSLRKSRSLNVRRDSECPSRPSLPLCWFPECFADVSAEPYQHAFVLPPPAADSVYTLNESRHCKQTSMLSYISSIKTSERIPQAKTLQQLRTLLASSLRAQVCSLTPHKNVTSAFARHHAF